MLGMKATNTGVLSNVFRLPAMCLVPGISATLKVVSGRYLGLLTGV